MTTEFPPADKPDAGYILELELENIRCFGPKQTLDLRAPGAENPARWTIILGENGTGKTTILQMFFMIYSIHHPGVAGIPTALVRNFLTIESLKNSSLSPLKILVTSKTNHDLKKHFIQSLDINDFSGSSRSSKDGTGIFIGHGANRRITRQQNYQAVEGYETLFSEDYGLRSPGEWFSAALGATFGKGVEAYQRVERHYKGLLEELPKLLPDVESVRVENLNSKLELWFTTPYGEVTIDQLSAGYRAMAAWVVDLASHMFAAYPDSEEPLKEPAVVLVDEFDLHLHPRWQREAVRFLTERFPAVQFIVTAHSPLVVQSAPDANIVVLRRVGDHVEIDNEPVSVKTWRVDQILSSELFGLEGMRPPDVEAKRARLEELLLMDARSEEEEAELERLDAELDQIAVGYNAAHIEALDFLQRVAEQMKGGEEP